MEQIRILENENKELQDTLDDILSAALAFSDKPHLLFSAIRRASIKHLGIVESEDLITDMDFMYGNIGKMLLDYENHKGKYETTTPSAKVRQ